jgi:hypothetical protein
MMKTVFLSGLLILATTAPAWADTPALPAQAGPTIVSATVASATSVTVAFSRAMDTATATDIANYTIGDYYSGMPYVVMADASAAATGTVTVIAAALSADQQTVTLTTSPMDVSAFYTLWVNNVLDTNVPPVAVAPNSTVDFSTPSTWTEPALVSVAASSVENVTVVFLGTVDAATATNVANYGLSCYGGAGGGDVIGMDDYNWVIGAVLAADQRTVTLTTLPMASSTLYTLVVNNVQDTSVPPNVIAPNSTMNFVTPAWPRLTSVAATSLVNVTVMFSAPVDAAAATDIANYAITVVPPIIIEGTTSASDVVMADSSGNVAVLGATLSADQRTVTLTTAPMWPGAKYRLQVNMATNSIVEFQAPAAPRILSATTTNLVNVTVVFSKAMDAATVTDVANYSLPGVTVTGAVTANATTVVLTTSPMAVATTYCLTVVNVQDTTVPPIAIGPYAYAWFTTPARPTVASAGTSNLVNLWISFSRAMDPATATNIANYAISGGVTVTAASSVTPTTVMLTTSPMKDSTSYTVTVNNVWDATLPPIGMTPNSVGSFTTPARPIIQSADAWTLEEVKVRFTKWMDTATSTDASNYMISGGVTVISAATDSPWGDTIVLTTSPMVPEKSYTLTVNNLQDTSAPPIALDRNSTATFMSLTRPTIVYAANSNLVNIKLYFSTLMDTTTVTNVTNYTMPGGVTVTGVATDGYQATLTTTPMDAGTTYTLTINNLQDAIVTPVTVAPNTIITFTTPTRPTLVAASASNLMNVWVGFSRGVNTASATAVANYAMSNGITVTGVSLYASQSVILTTSRMTPGTTYTLTVNNVGDWTGPPIIIAPDSTVTFTTPAAPGIASATATSLASVKVAFSKTVSMATATSASNYAVSGGVTVTGATRYDYGTVVLSTSPMAPGTAYTVTALNIADTLLPPIVTPSSTQAFMTPGPSAVAITTPPSGCVCGGGWTVVLTATASDVGGAVRGIEFFDGATKLGDAGFDSATSSWTFGWSTAGAAYGSHSITVKATDTGGLTATSAPTSVRISIPGDGNGDGVVDGLDYGIWQNGFNRPGASFAMGDYNNDGIVDAMDYGVWADHYQNHATYSSDGAASSGDGSLATTADAPAVATEVVRPPAASYAQAPRLIAMTPAPGASATGMTTLVLAFDGDVTVGAGAAEVYGAVTGYHSDYAATYDVATHTLTLRWATALPADAYTVRLVSGFVMGEGGALDGEVIDPIDPAALPSGDGKAGGDAMLAFQVR